MEIKAILKAANSKLLNRGFKQILNIVKIKPKTNMT